MNRIVLWAGAVIQWCMHAVPHMTHSHTRAHGCIVHCFLCIVKIVRIKPEPVGRGGAGGWLNKSFNLEKNLLEGIRMQTERKMLSTAQTLSRQLADPAPTFEQTFSSHYPQGTGKCFSLQIWNNEIFNKIPGLET